MEPGTPVLQTFQSSDGYVWNYRHYTPSVRDSSKPPLRLIFLHGIQSHGGWYTRSCGELAKAGYEVYFLERRGCGLNGPPRGDFSGFRRCLDDIAEWIKTIPTGGPKVLAGISWGGKLATAFPKRHPGLIDAIALLCPGFFPKVRPSLKQRLNILRARLVRPNKLFPIPLNDPNLFTASPAWQDFIRNDPLALRDGTARMLAASTMLDIYLKRARKKVTVPVLLLLGELDRIIDNQATRKFVSSFPSPDLRILEYPQTHHTLEFESPEHPWLADLQTWLVKIEEIRTVSK